MSVYFKLKIDENEDGKIKAITVRNQKINFGLFTFLHQVVHTAIRMYNWVIVVNGNTAKKSSYTYDYFEESLSEGIKEAVKILKENETIHR